MKSIEQRVKEVVQRQAEWINWNPTHHISDIFLMTYEQADFHFELEKEFEIEISEQDFDHCVTLSDIVRLIKKL